MSKKNKNIIDFPIPAFWENQELPSFLARTKTEYVKLPHSVLGERGVDISVIDELIKALPEGAYICGGFALSLFSGIEGNAKDIDIMFTSEEAFKKTFELLETPPAKPKKEINLPFIDPTSSPEEKEEDIYKRWRDYELETNFEDFKKNPKSHRFVVFKHEKRPKIQLIKLSYYEDGAHVIDTFDFTITQIAICKDFIYLNPLTILDLANKKLVLHRMQFPASTLRRLIKYAAKGYYACPGSLVNIATQIMEHKGNLDIVNNQSFVYID